MMQTIREPESKTQFIVKIQTERATWEAALAQLSVVEMTARNGKNNWSVKDIIAHTMSYQQFMAQRLLDKERDIVYQPSQTSEALTAFAEKYGYPDFGSPLLDDDLPNAWVFQKYHAYPLSEVMALEQQVFTTLLEAVERLSEEKLIKEGLYQNIANNTWVHYQEHTADILARQASEITIRPATPADAEPYSQLRLEALREHPNAFGADYEANLKLSPKDWETQLQARTTGDKSILFLACAGGELVGMTGVFRGNPPKMFHNGFVWGVYVRAAYRGQGISRRLLEACIDWASEKGVEQLKLAVVSTNTAAICTYTASGFQVYGVEPRVLRVDGVDYDELLMVREINVESEVAHV